LNYAHNYKPNQKMKNSQTQKINKLIREWQSGVVVTSSFLAKNGFSTKLIHWYISSGWIESIGYGAYKRAGDNVDWYGALFALQNQLGLNVHPGGKTALELQGYAHYLAEKLPAIYLFGLQQERLPKWFLEYDWGTEIRYAPTSLFSKQIPESFTDYKHKEFSIFVSAPERAAMEMLYHIPRKQGFAEASHIMENLAMLRPQLVQQLLEGCKSVKVKRLFLYFADQHNHEWLSQLNTEKIDLGAGKRVIVKNGKLDSKYLITVIPETRI